LYSSLSDDELTFLEKIHARNKEDEKLRKEDKAG
jgi:hypothetical protein